MDAPSTALRRHLPARIAPRDPCDASVADEAWLRMERPDNRMVITALMVLGRPLGLSEVKALVSRRILRHPRFTEALHRDRRHFPGVPFDLDAHVRPARLPSDEPAALQRFVAELMRQPLPPERPLWQVQVIEGYQGGTALIWRIHHALGDGVALMRVLIDAADTQATLPAPHALAHRARKWVVLRGLGSLGKLVLLPADRKTALKGALSGVKELAVSEPIPLAQLKAAAHAGGATVNDVLLSALAAALSQRLAHDDSKVRNLRAVVPLDLRQGETDEQLGNRFGLVFLTLPVGPLTAGQRLAEVKRRMDRIKRQPEAMVAFRILELIGLVSLRLADVAVKLFGAKASLIVTNVPGPTQPLSLAGAPLREMMFWVPQGGGIGVGVSLFSYAGFVRLGIATDVARVGDPQQLVDAFEAEVASLTP